MLKTVAGIYRHGRIELSEIPPDIVESRIIVTFLDQEQLEMASTPTPMSFGMFAGANQSTTADFRLAEFTDADATQLMP
ncbi:MAG: hypothetical protein HC910_17130 [Spirulinaceae cyanobacterium SM2_1_0]|nr:hypothetical protein [Spirulinaceae cyanobacterium SM2_1_0]